MSLELLVRGIKWVDRQIERKYALKVRDAEANGKSRYDLARRYERRAMVGIVGAASLTTWLAGPLGIVTFIPLYPMARFSEQILPMMDQRARNAESKGCIDPVVDDLKGNSKRERLFFYGLGHALYGMAVVGAFFTAGPDGLEYLTATLTAGFLGDVMTSSGRSKYVLSADPTVLDKAPWYERAWNWVKTKGRKPATQKAYVPLDDLFHQLLQKQTPYTH